MTKKNSATGKDRSSSLLTHGNRALREGKYTDAIAFYEEAIKQTPDLHKIIAGNISIARRKSSDLPEEGSLKPSDLCKDFSKHALITPPKAKNEVTIRSGRDAFMLRGLKPQSRIAIILDTENLSDLQGLSTMLQHCRAA